MTKNECPAAPAPTSTQSSGGGGGAVRAAVRTDPCSSPQTTSPAEIAEMQASGRRTEDLRNSARLLTQRRPQPLLTQNFTDLWRDVYEPLRCYLASTGLARHDIDDITQETATRALERGVAATDVVTFRRWVFVVAKHLAFDLYRARRRWADIDEAAGVDVAQESALIRVEDRHLLRTVSRAVAALPRGERDSLVGSSSAGVSAADRNRTNVARHRARRRLRHLVGPLAVAVAWLRHPGHSTAVGGALAAAALPFAVLSGLHDGHPDRVPAVRTEQSPVAVETVGLVTSQEATPPRTHSQPHSRSVEPSGLRGNGAQGRKIPPVSVQAPWVSVRTEPPSGHAHMLCFHQDDALSICVDSPPSAAIQLRTSNR